ncbi:MAG TPA: nucleoside hydrolase [Candidatus Acidoferrales bacterium]|nr:nucleoside hydrolase [Candidatus Acidoferrales bacterium]
MTRLLKLGLLIALFLGMVLVLGRPVLSQNRDVIVTTDCGADIDDQFAIAYLFLLPQIHVKGIVTTHAPSLPKNAGSSAACVQDVLQRLRPPSAPPVFAGSDVPLTGRTPLRNPGVDFTVNTSRKYSAHNRLVIVTMGATTDVASAFLQDPTLGDRVEIVTMGFDSWPKGTDPWNIKNDPLAYQVILDSSAPITIGGTEVCRKYLELDGKSAARMLHGHGEFAEWLNTLFDNWVTNNAELVASVVSPGHWVIWDTVVVAHLLGFTTEQTYRRPALNLADLSFSFPKTEKTVRWITAINSEKMWPDFVQRLDRVNARR